MSKKVLGLDIGIVSVGWSVVDLESGKIVDCGSRIFQEGNSTENLKRRTTRGKRRLIRRKANRISDAKKLLAKKGMTVHNSLVNPYEARIKGLNDKLSNDEFVSAYLHIVKRRGSSFETVEDDETKKDESDKTKAVLSRNDAIIATGKFPCQIQFERLKECGKARGKENNFRTIHYIKELEKILSNQGFDREFESKLLDLVRRKRKYYEGPGSQKSPTQYGRFFYNERGEIEEVNLIEKMRGKCSVYPQEFRAPKLSPSAELFNFMNDLNNLSVGDRKIEKSEKEFILEKHIYSGKHSITPKELAKVLSVNVEEISGFRIDKSNKNILTSLVGYKLLLNAIDDEHYNRDFKLLDDIADVLTATKDVEERKDKISKLNNQFSAEVVANLANLNKFTKYHSLSFKVIKELLPELIDTSDNQMQILSRRKLIKGDVEIYKGLVNIPFDDNAILSPVAKRSINESLKIINKARKIYGEFDTVIIEMAREKNSDDKKATINKIQRNNEKLNKYIEELTERKDLNLKTRQKIRLYLEQECKCLYTGMPIDLNTLISDSTAYEIDHIIPISIAFDDSMHNKVLVYRSANQSKGQRSPKMAFDNNKFEGWGYQEFHTYCLSLLKSSQITTKKFMYLVFDRDITSFDTMKEFINRNLVDTRYASRVVLNALQSYFRANEIDTNVMTIRGAVTSQFRKMIDLPKNRDQDYTHHAIDASIMALLAKKKSFYEIMRNTTIKDDIINVDESELPVEDYYDSNLIKLIKGIKNVKSVKISHKVDRKINRKIANETIYSTRKVEGVEKVVAKYSDIYDSEFLNLAKDIAEGKTEKYLMKEIDPKTFNILESVVNDYLRDHGKIEKKNPFSLFKDEHGAIRKYSKNNNGPVVTSIKYYHKKLGNYIDVSERYQKASDESKAKRVVLQQISPYRTDFYLCDDGTYGFVTVRYKDIRYYKSEDIYRINSDWYVLEKGNKNIDSNAKFVFSLNRNDYLEITKKEKGSISRGLFRFIATNDDKRRIIEVKPIDYYDNNRLKPTIGRDIINIKKFNVDVLGNMYEVETEDLKLEFKL